MIAFNVPAVTGHEKENINKIFEFQKFAGDGKFTKLCHKWFEEKFEIPKALLTTSCTDALELAAILIGVKEGDEVIMPSYTFVSTANAFALRGAKIRFVDIDGEHANLSLSSVKEAINSNTVAVVAVNYGGWSADLKSLRRLCDEKKIYLIEDAAQSILAKYDDQYLGTYGDISAFSFHETKNIQCGEGGAIFINNPKLVERAEIIREKGTDRSRFLRGEIDKYSWVSIGSSFLPSELNAAFLYAQLEQAETIINRRKEIWSRYAAGLNGIVPFLTAPAKSEHNGHIFGVLAKDINHRQIVIDNLKENSVHSVFHYLPLHLAGPASVFGVGNDADFGNTLKISDTIIRLPLHYSLKDAEVDKVIDQLKKVY